MKIRLLIIYCLAAATPMLYAQDIFQGDYINESQLNSFIKSLRLIQPGIDTADDMGFAGSPHYKLNDKRSENWKYIFRVMPDSLMAETESIERQLSELRDQDMQLTQRLFKVQKEAFKQNSKALFSEVDRIADSKKRISDIEKPLIARNIELGRSRALQTFEVNCEILVDSNRRIRRVEVSKGSVDDRELVYSKGATEDSITTTTNNKHIDVTKSEPNTQTSDGPPQSPALGQIYFNTTDKCFYGWNGTKWDRLSGGH